jgi:hypothetical protein
VTLAHDSVSDNSLRLAQRLVRQGRLDQPLAKAALARARERRQRLEDALVDCGVSEHVLLRHLADLYRTQLISTEKLEHAKLSPRVLRMVPKNLAERHLVVPIVLTANGELVVATPDPESVDLIKDVQLASQAREVKTTVARPAAVLAAIRKFYDGDMHAFRSLTESGPVTEGIALELTDNQGGTSIATATLSERPPPPLPDPRARSRSNRKSSAPRQAQVKGSPGGGRQPARPSTELEMAPPTAHGAATSASSPPLGEPFPLASDSLFPTATVTRSQQPALHRAPRAVAAQPELELAIDDTERARLPESGRGRHAEPVLQASSLQFDATPMSGASLAEDPSDYGQFGGSLPPALGGLFASSPPAAPDLAGSLPPTLGFVSSAPPRQASESSLPGVFDTTGDGDSSPPIFGSSSVAPAAPEGSMPPALGFFASVAPMAVGPTSNESAPPMRAPAPARVAQPSNSESKAAEPAPPPKPNALAGPNSLQQWMAALDSSPPPDNTVLRALPGPPRVGSPLSVPPTASAIEGESAPYSLTHGQSLLGAPLLFARSFVALFERPHGALAAHSIVLSELTRLVAVELGWSQESQEHAELAALLHDLGKSKSRHLTPFSVWYYVEYEQIARQQFLLPLQLFAASGLPAPVVQALTHLYERVDGRGFPSSLSGDAVPQLSQVVGLCDSYLDLTLHAHNPFGRVLAPREALTALKEKAGSLFDLTLVETLTQLVLVEGIDVRARQRQVTL